MMFIHRMRKIIISNVVHKTNLNRIVLRELAYVYSNAFEFIVTLSKLQC